MIALTKSPCRTLTAQENEQFVTMLPQIRYRAHLAFRELRADDKEELIEEAIANAFCRFVGLVCGGKANVAYATPLANFAIRQVIDGRRVGTRPSLRDVMSSQARANCGVVVERLDRFDEKQGQWREVLVEDRRAGPAETAAARIDLADWFRSLSRRDRRLAKTLAAGETTSEAARQFNLSQPRISQLREELRVSWLAFQGEEIESTSTGRVSQRGRSAAVA